MIRKLIYAVLAIVMVGTALFFLSSREPAPAAQPPVPVSRGTEPLPPGTKVMPRLEPILEKAEGIDMEKESARFADFFNNISTSPVINSNAPVNN